MIFSLRRSGFPITALMEKKKKKTLLINISMVSFSPDTPTRSKIFDLLDTVLADPPRSKNVRIHIACPITYEQM